MHAKVYRVTREKEEEEEGGGRGVMGMEEGNWSIHITSKMEEEEVGGNEVERAQRGKGQRLLGGAVLVYRQRARARACTHTCIHVHTYTHETSLSHDCWAE